MESIKVIVRFINEQEEICMNQGQGRSVVDVMRDAQRAKAIPINIFVSHHYQSHKSMRARAKHTITK